MTTIPPNAPRRPLIGITTDLAEVNGRPRAWSNTTYAHAVTRAGGCPILLPPLPDLASEHAALCDAYVLTGGDDPKTEPFGRPTHPEANPVLADRQAYETALLGLLRDVRPDTPVLGICLGMQMMALLAGGELDQHMPDTMPDAQRHWDAEHPLTPEPAREAPLDLPEEAVFSRHRQAVRDAGEMHVLARSDDGVIEAIFDPSRRWHVGVQWHPERTKNAALGAAVFESFINAIGAYRDDPRATARP